MSPNTHCTILHKFENHKSQIICWVKYFYFMLEVCCSKPLILGVWDLSLFFFSLCLLDLGTLEMHFIFVLKFYQHIDSPMLLKIVLWDVMKTLLNLRSLKVNILMILYVNWAEKFSEVAFSTKLFIYFHVLLPTSVTTLSMFLNFSLGYIFVVIFFRVYSFPLVTLCENRNF